MNITYQNTRYEPDGRLCHAAEPQQITPGKAVVNLCRFELGYGGRITTLEPTRIVVRTVVMEFTGSEEAMKPLMLAVAAWAQGQKVRGKEHIAKTVNSMMENGLNLPIHATMMGVLAFASWASPIMLVAAGLDVEQSKQLLEMAEARADKWEKEEKGKGWNPYRKTRRSYLNDIIDPTIELLVEGAPFDEALELASA